MISWYSIFLILYYKVCAVKDYLQFSEGEMKYRLAYYHVCSGGSFNELQ